MGSEQSHRHIETADALTLEECITMALEQNRLLQVSRVGVEIAKSRHRQALSAYWPQVNLRSAFMQMDENPNFLFPEETSTYTIKTSLFAGQPPIEMESTVTVPQKDVKLMDRTNFMTSLGFLFPVFTGGLRRAYVTQAKSGLQIAEHEQRRTELEICFDVKRIYYGGVLARNVKQIGIEALNRLEVLLDLTENLYKEGSGKVKKTDYLKTRMIVESARSMVAVLENNVEIARSALTMMIGMEWDAVVGFAEEVIPYRSSDLNLHNVIDRTYRLNPDWAKLKAGLDALEAGIMQARSGYFPKIALTGSIVHVENPYDAGMMSPGNKDTWVLGIGLDMPIMSGFRTKYQVKEAKARLKSLKQQEILLKEGLALKVKHALLRLKQAESQVQAVRKAVESAVENRNLLESAYQEDLAELQELIEAQIMESVMKAQYQKLLFDHYEAEANLEFIVGTRFHQLLNGDH